MADTPPLSRAVWPASLPLIDAQPRRPRWWALLLGLLSATGFEPLGLWPVALLAGGAGILLFARAQSWKQAALLGWLFGLAHFTFGNNWIATAFTYQANMPAFLGWFAVPLMALVLAIYPAIAAAAARAIVRGGPGSVSSAAFALVFAGCWIVSEWLRAWVLTGYAWNPFAMVLLGPFDRPGLASLSVWMGTYALSGLAMLLGFALIEALRLRRWLALGVGALVLAAGMYRPAADPADSELQVTVVQPDIRQDTVHLTELAEINFQKLAGQSPRLPTQLQASTPEAKRIVLWPESGMADYLREGYPQGYYDATTAFGSPVLARRRLGEVIGAGSLLLTGAVDLEIGEADGYPRAIGGRNSVTVLDNQGEILGEYYKAHLVPFGEFLPFRGLLEPMGLSRFVPGSFDFWPGPGPRTLDLGEYGQAGVLICYEIIFSGEQTQDGARPDYIFNPSNDGWYGSFGPPQHLAQARMRAIEEGLPVLRSTTTGISAIIDAQGVVRGHLGSNQLGRIDRFVPQAAPPTLFSRLGNVLGLGWAALFCALGLIALRRSAR